jgi:hypothetical protein
MSLFIEIGKQTLFPEQKEFFWSRKISNRQTFKELNKQEQD